MIFNNDFYIDENDWLWAHSKRQRSRCGHFMRFLHCWEYFKWWFLIYDIEIKIDENDGLEAHCERQRSGCGHFPADVVSRNRRPKHRFDFQTLPAIFVQNDAPSPPPPTPPSNTVHSCWTCLFSGHLEGDGFWADLGKDLNTARSHNPWLQAGGLHLGGNNMDQQDVPTIAWVYNTHPQ